MTRKLPSITIKELIESGAHFGHRTMRWNPKMSSYLFGKRDGIHIIDLQQTLPLLNAALEKIYDVAKSNGRILFVGTKMQASEILAEEAIRCGQHYVNHRWLGGILTNWATINNSIKKLRDLEQLLIDAGDEGDEDEMQFAKVRFTKKERLDISRKIDKLEKSLGGIREMGGVPEIIFIIDTNMEDLAIQEAKTLGIPVVAILDSNSNPDNIDYPIPGNDDASRAISLYCRLVADTVLYGMQEALVNSGVDFGASADISNIVGLNSKNDKAKDIKVNKTVKVETSETNVEKKEKEVETKAVKAKKTTAVPVEMKKITKAKKATTEKEV
jgi:small subunit ribosomal protein S2